MKQTIGMWNSYNVNMCKEKKRTYWTIESKDGTEHNRFYSSESFGHWVYHSGFKAKAAGVEKERLKAAKHKLVVS